MKHNEELIEDIALYVQGEYKMGGSCRRVVFRLCKRRGQTIC